MLSECSATDALQAATENLASLDICPELQQLQALLEDLKINSSPEKPQHHDTPGSIQDDDDGDQGSCDGDSDGGGFDIEDDASHQGPIPAENSSLSLAKSETDGTASQAQDASLEQAQVGDVDLLSHGDSALEWLATMVLKAISSLVVVVVESSGLGLWQAISKSSSWAGPDHWKYRKPKKEESALASQAVESSDSSRAQEKMSKRKKQEDIDFENPPQVGHSLPCILGGFFFPPSSFGLG